MSNPILLYDNLIYRISNTFALTNNGGAGAVVGNYATVYMGDGNPATTCRIAIPVSSVQIDVGGDLSNVLIKGAAIINSNITSVGTASKLYGSNNDFAAQTEIEEFTQVTQVDEEHPLVYLKNVVHWLSCLPNLGYKKYRFDIRAFGNNSYLEIGQLFIAAGFYQFVKNIDFGGDVSTIVASSNSITTQGQSNWEKKYGRRIFSGTVSHCLLAQKTIMEAAANRGYVVYSHNGTMTDAVFGVMTITNAREMQSDASGNIYYSISYTVEESPFVGESFLAGV